MIRAKSFGEIKSLVKVPAARVALLGFAVVFVLSLIVQTGLKAAPDLSDMWDLNNPADYNYDSGIEMVSGTARLKAQNYATDANTSALYHFDESGGAVATDSTGQNNASLIGGTFSTGNLNNSVNLNGSTDYIAASSSSSLQLGSQQTIEGWTKFNSTFGANSQDKRNTLVDKGDYQLYYDNETGKVTYEIANSNGQSWDAVSGGWNLASKRSVSSSVVSGSNVFVGLGNAVGDAEVWRWNGTAWTKIGGDGINSSWADQTFEEVNSLTSDGTNIYAGLGNSTGDGEVWRWNGTAWTKIGGDSLNGSWGIGTYESIPALYYFNSNLYAGLGTGANDAEVWRWNGTAWTKIGGDSLNSGWTTNFETVYSFADDGTNIYAGIGNSTTDAEVWRWNGTAWTKIGGDGVNSSWNTNYESVRSLKYQAGVLYAGIGDNTTDAEVWRWNGTAWAQIGGDGLNSSWNTNYEAVYSLAGDGTNLYAGIGNSDGDGEVWRWNGTAWAQIGGDGLNSSWASAAGDIVMTLASGSGGTIYAGLYDAAGGGYFYSWNGTAWTVRGGQHINNSWGYYGFNSVEVMQQIGDYLYAGLGNTAGSAQLWRTNGTNGWEMVGGQGFNGSWSSNTYEYISSISSFGNDVVVGLGSSANDAEVWRWNGSSWNQIGGDSLNSGWTTNYEEVNMLLNYGGNLYAGIGNSTTDAEVWRWNGTAWTKIGGDGVNSSWNTSYEKVSSGASLNGQLYIGLGNSAGDAEVWRWNGATWTKIGGDLVSGSWDSTFEQVESMVSFDNKIIVGLGNSTDDAEVWQYNGTTWTKIGGDGANNSWISGTYETVRGLTAYSGDLYAGIGNTTGDAEVWKLSGGSWSKLGGSVNGSWGNAIEDIRSLTTFKGSLYAGTGTTANADAVVWKFGDNGYLQSTASSFDTNWHHIAATYNGTTMKIFIDGALNASLNKAIATTSSNKDLLIGSGYGGASYGKNVPRFEGKLDEFRLSNIARTSFTTTPFSNTEQTISPKSSVRKNGVWHWDTISNTATLNGGSINYRLSANDGVSWLYWDGVGWTESDNLTKVNSTAQITANFDSFPVTYDGMRWQAVIKGDGNQQVTLDGVDAAASSDSGLPSNPADITAYKANGGGSLTENSWTNGSSPYFTWTAGSDSQSGVKGYCIYLGTDNTADPITAKGLLGSSPAKNGGNCQFMVESTSLDLGVPGMLASASPLTTSNSNYYLNIRSIDIAGNVANTSKQFSFKFDNTPPANPSYINAPSGFVNTKEITMTWPSSGTGAPDDANSGLAGLQYKIGTGGTWYGDSHSGTGDMTDLLTNDGSYMTVDPPDYANLIEGVNLVYFRSWDLAGNVTTSYATASLKINTSGAPTEPNNLTATPSSNTVNAFAFSWNAPGSYVGDVSKITYCYTVNSLPSDSTCSYTPAGVTSLGSGPYATQPGSNTLYVVARDESGNKNYSNYASVSFSANTPSPGIPLNSDLVDVSIKSTNNWRLALTWDQPSSVGAGIANYRVYRSTNGTSFTQIGTSSSTTYIDAGLSQQTYYYKIAACDSTNNCGAAGSVVSGLPTGKFTSPASITSGPTVSGVTTKKAKISWTTDRGSDSKVAIGTSSGKYGSSEIGNSAQVTNHDIGLDNLSPGTTYYFVVKWTDEDGNTGTSTEKSFTTAPAPVVKEVTASSVTLSGATIDFTTKGSTKAAVYYGTSESFGGLKTINTSVQESSYQVRLDGLTDGTKYYYMISTFDEEGSEYKGNVASFSTPPRPRITNLRFQPIDGEPTSTQKVSWETNVPSTTQVVYGVAGGKSLEEQDSKMVTSHEIVIKNLQDDSRYVLVAQSRDNSGNLASSDQQVFQTALDTRPPKVSDIVIEPSIRGTGSEARGQIVVSWRTDEPSTSQVAYTEGSGAVTFNSKTAEDTRMTTEHLVIISDLPTSRVFSVQPLSKDKSNNEAVGEADTAIIGRASDSVLTIVFNTLRSIFGL